jgi:hypothetical protein
VARFATIPEGLRVDADGSWRIGDDRVSHDRSLFFFKSHLVFEEAGAFIVDGGRRLPVEVTGPAFEVVRLDVDALRGQARAVLDDGTEETLGDGLLSMHPDTGRFVCAVRGGRAQALLSRTAHQALIEHAEEDSGSFYLRAGLRRFRIRT